jgi:hypothetical protein
MCFWINLHQIWPILGHNTKHKLKRTVFLSAKWPEIQMGIWYKLNYKTFIEHLCQVWFNSVQWFSRRRLIVKSYGQRTPSEYAHWRVTLSFWIIIYMYSGGWVADQLWSFRLPLVFEMCLWFLLLQLLLQRSIAWFILEPVSLSTHRKFTCLKLKFSFTSPTDKVGKTS